MKLSREDAGLFFKLYLPLLDYTKSKLNMTAQKSKGFLRFEEQIDTRDALYSKIDLIDSFVEENSGNFSDEEIEILLGWKNFVKGTFFLCRYLKKYAIFLDTETPPKAYGVLALNDGFDELLGDYLPIALETVLLPFKGQIIYDGLVWSHNVFFGSNFRKSLDDAYQEAKARFGIITTLPFNEEEVEQSDADKLKFYLKNQRNRDRYWEEIEELREKNRELKITYYQEMGKIHARTLRKQLRQTGITDTWFAVLEDIIIASGKTKREVESILEKILPPEKQEFAYTFHLK